MVMNGGVEVNEVLYINHDSFSCVGVKNKVSENLYVALNAQNQSKIGQNPPLALLVNHNDHIWWMGAH